MRDATNLPIFIISSNYTQDKRFAALEQGADAYYAFCNKKSKNVTNTLKLLAALNRWVKQPTKKLPVLIRSDIVLSHPRMKAFVGDTELTLTNHEFSLLHYFMLKPGQFLSGDELLSNIWNENNEPVTLHALWSTIKRLRKKLRILKDSPSYITTSREVGYRLD
jgi:DNA-binding response OmpR family regulator